MSGRRASKRFIATVAALLLLLAVPLGAPAVADPGLVRVMVVLDSPELLANINDTSGPSIDTDVTFEVFSAGDGALVLEHTQTGAHQASLPESASLQRRVTPTSRASSMPMKLAVPKSSFASGQESRWIDLLKDLLKDLELFCERHVRRDAAVSSAGW